MSHELQDMTPEAWKYIKEKGFLGMIIPKKFGGLEFSVYAHSQVVTVVDALIRALAVSVMVLNCSARPSYPALHYGTDAQKKPPAASGQGAGDTGVCADKSVGRLRCGVDPRRRDRLQRACGRARKSSVCALPGTNATSRLDRCTILGLAFHLYDPDGLLGTKKHIGITCALVPWDTLAAKRAVACSAQRDVHERSDTRQGYFHAASTTSSAVRPWPGRLAC